MLEQDRFREDLTKILTPLSLRSGDGGGPRSGPEVDTATWYNTPAVAVAAATSSASGGYDECHAEWGARRLPGGPAPDADTLFQACSISKAFQSLAVLRYVSEGAIGGLDDPVAPHLPGEAYRALLDSSVRRGVPADLAARLLDRMTIAELLSHTAGTMASGFQGYPTSTGRFPSTAEILRGGGGDSPGGGAAVNSPAVLVHGIPGVQFEYSGGGSTVLQAMLEHVGARRDGLGSFAAVMRAKVLGPLGMARSFYCGGAALPPSEDNYAAGCHNGTHGLERGEYHVHPEDGAAGLWTTPRDLVRGMTALARALLGGAAGPPPAGPDGAPWVRPEVARQVLLARPGLAHGGASYYLGFHVEFLGGDGGGGGGEGRLARDAGLVCISHAGGNYGYRCWAAAAFPLPGEGRPAEEEEGGEAVAATVRAQAVMTNSNCGGDAVGPLVLAVGEMLDSPLGPGGGDGAVYAGATPAVALDPRPAAPAGGRGWAPWAGEWRLQDRTQTLRVVVAGGEEGEEEAGRPAVVVVFSHLGDGVELPLWAAAERKGPERTRFRVGPLDATLEFGWSREEGEEASLALCTGGSRIKCLGPS